MIFLGGCLAKTVAWKLKRWQRLTLVFWVLALAILPAQAEDGGRQAEVARRGTDVMPFSLAQTQHQFTKTETGGIQRVVSRDPHNHEQIRLIRQHLKQLAERFTRGDFSGPESIHGSDMPGLAQLREAKQGSLHIIYTAEPAGARLTFRSDDTLLVRAIHDWFDAQLHDHGHDAMEVHHHPQ